MEIMTKGMQGRAINSKMRTGKRETKEENKDRKIKEKSFS